MEFGVKELADIAESADLEPLGLKHETERIQDRRIVVDGKNQRSRDHFRKSFQTRAGTVRDIARPLPLAHMPIDALSGPKIQIHSLWNGA